MSREGSTDVEKVRMYWCFPEKCRIEWMVYRHNLNLEFLQEIRDLDSIEFCFVFEERWYLVVSVSDFLETCRTEIVIEFLIILLIFKDANKSSLSESNRMKKDKGEKWVHILRDYDFHK